MYEQSHTTEPVGDSTLHYWEIRGPRGAVSLSAVEMTPEAAVVVADIARGLPSVDPIISTDAGMIFDVLQSHHVTLNAFYPCTRHGAGCNMDAFTSGSALPVWQSAVAGGMTDEAVYAQLGTLFVVEFGEVPA